jgi:hypothetical protein
MRSDSGCSINISENGQTQFLFRAYQEIIDIYENTVDLSFKTARDVYDIVTLIKKVFYRVSIGFKNRPKPMSVSVFFQTDKTVGLSV